MRITRTEIERFRRFVKGHYRRYGRTMPWRETRDPYCILVSEIMLQQTQVDRVIRYYEKFLTQFPDIAVLAASPLADVLAAWQGLGYNRRALYLKRSAEEIVARHGGSVPREVPLLAKLPGIGAGTAGAIAAFAFNTPTPFIETNIRRVYLHFFFPRRRRVSDTALMPLIEKTLDRKNPREWYYALMDYGAMLGVAHKGEKNPNRRSRHYTRQSRFVGSDRQLRGKIITSVLKEKQLNETILHAKLNINTKRIKMITVALLREGLLTKKNNKITISL